MFLTKASMAAFAGNLIAAKSTSITAAAVLVATFLPISGGAIKPYELREFSAGVAALANGESAASRAYRVLHPEWGGKIQLAAIRPENNARVTRLAYIPAEEETEIGLSGAASEDFAALTAVFDPFDEPIEVCADDCVTDGLEVDELEPLALPDIAREEPIEMELG